MGLRLEIRWARWIVPLLVAACGPAMAGAQAYPAKAIRLVVPYPPGGFADLAARPFAEKLSARLGQPVVIDNRAGASGTIGSAAVAHAAPDGYTLLFTTANEIAVSPLLYKSLSYTPQSFAPIAAAVDFSMVLVTGDRAVESVSALLARAREGGKSLAFASSGAGTTNHLSAELFRQQLDIPVLHVHYKGGGPAMADVIGGQVDAMFATLPSALPLIQSGRLHALAVTSAQRSPVLPAVPTAGQASGHAVDVVTWSGLLGPRGLPEAIVRRLSEAAQQVVDDPEYAAFLLRHGAEPHFAAPGELQQWIERDHARWKRIIEDGDVRNQ